ncbi:MAG: hypothetical protein L0H63_05195 [Nitrococcus sp.]|nr:hypothetical protein [Nitrococcus sp.]
MHRLVLLKIGLGPFVQRGIKRAIEAKRLIAHDPRDYAEDWKLADKLVPEWDVACRWRLSGSQTGYAHKV